MLKFEGTTILLPAGDTAILAIQFKGATLGEGDKAIFAILTRDGNNTLLTKTMDISDDVALQKFESEDTQNIHPGDYRWELRVVINPIMENGEIVGGDQIHTPFAFNACCGNGFPIIRIQKVGVNV